MALDRIKNSTFHRIGDRYNHYIDPDHFLGQSSMDNFERTKPQRNVKNVNDSWKIDVALPGFRKDEIDVTMENNTLVVRADKDESENFKDNFLRQEFHTNTQETRFELGNEVDRDGISCVFTNGVLHINLPHKQGDVKVLSRQVKVL